ncbi:Bug family tripartite tricarboxylate transporter substrate binding protein [Xanthomonas axonopodis]|uniref:Bug family tripartite tricarboxylate transporter substrate binding protein n=1 Tax=Xanthomonas axonopodis TaxID=53413 RepID=UPI003558B375
MNALLKGLLAGVIACTAATAWADAYPNKAIRIVVPFPPGGGSDTLARLIGVELGKTLGQSVVVENKPGAAGMIATAYVASSAPDGYILLLADVPFTSNVAVYPNPLYKIDQFAPVATIANVPAIVVTNNKLPVDSMADLIAQSKKSPGALNMASGGAGSVAHLQGAQIAQAMGAEWTHIPYRGMGPAAMDVIAGQADLMVASAPTVVGHLKDKRLKALAVTTAKRSDLLPDTPTFAELGYPGLTTDNWFGLVVPAKTDPAIIKKLNEQVNAALAEPNVLESLAAQMATPLAITPEQFDKIIQRDTEKWADVVKATHITAN